MTPCPHSDSELLSSYFHFFTFYLYLSPANNVKTSNFSQFLAKNQRVDYHTSLIFWGIFIIFYLRLKLKRRLLLLLQTDLDVLYGESMEKKKQGNIIHIPLARLIPYMTHRSKDLIPFHKGSSKLTIIGYINTKQNQASLSLSLPLFKCLVLPPSLTRGGK